MILKVRMDANLWRSVGPSQIGLRNSKNRFEYSEFVVVSPIPQRVSLGPSLRERVFDGFLSWLLIAITSYLKQKKTVRSPGWRRHLLLIVTVSSLELVYKMPSAMKGQKRERFCLGGILSSSKSIREHSLQIWYSHVRFIDEPNALLTEGSGLRPRVCCSHQYHQTSGEFSANFRPNYLGSGHFKSTHKDLSSSVVI